MSDSALSSCLCGKPLDKVAKAPIEFEMGGVAFVAKSSPFECSKCAKKKIEALHAEIPDLLFMKDGKVHVNWAHFKVLHDTSVHNDGDSRRVEASYEKLIELVKAAVGVIQEESKGGYSPWTLGVHTPMALTWRWDSWMFLYLFVEEYHCHEYIDQVLFDMVVQNHKHRWRIRHDL